jgi:hypothetical protein
MRTYIVKFKNENGINQKEFLTVYVYKSIEDTFYEKYDKKCVIIETILI